MALKLKDASEIFTPHINEVAEVTSEGASTVLENLQNKLININSASVLDLDVLPGI